MLTRDDRQGSCGFFLVALRQFAKVYIAAHPIHADYVSDSVLNDVKGLESSACNSVRWQSSGRSFE